MGVLHGRDLLSTKYITAIIIDSLSGAHFVPIKHEIGNYFFANINNNLYCFDTRGEQFTYRQTLVKSFRFYIYFTDCFKPVSQWHKNLEMVLLQNNLPKMDRMMHKFFALLSRNEEKEFKTHEIPALLNKLEERKQEPQYQQLYMNMINFIKDLGIKEVVTPIRRVTESVTGDFIIPDPQFMATIRNAFEMLDREDKIINNVPIGAKTAWLKWLALLLIIALTATLGYMGYAFGWFDAFTGFIPDLSGGGGGGLGVPGFGGMTVQDQEFMNRYPTTASARAALDAGKITVDEIPPSIRQNVLDLKPPKASP